MKTKKQNRSEKTEVRKPEKFKNINLFTIILIWFSFVMLYPLGAKATDQSETDPVMNNEVTEWDARLEYARLLSNLKRYEESLVQYHKLQHEKPDSIDVQVGIAEVLFYQGKRQEALALLEKIPVKDINDKTRLLMAQVYQALKEYSKAESIYREQLRKMPNDSFTKLKLAELLSWQKRYNESILLYRQLLVEMPTDIQVRRKYAMVLMWMGEEDQAAEELEKTLKN